MARRKKGAKAFFSWLFKLFSHLRVHYYYIKGRNVKNIC